MPADDAVAADAASSPTVSCLMVTANRRALCRRSIQCYNQQTHPNRELVVVDDGTQDLTPVLKAVPDDELTYVPLDPDADHVLGYLRNVALDAASGDFLTQWDDDDWYHPERIERQAAVLQAGYDACCLHGTLMHIDAEPYFYHPYIGFLEDGVPGSIMHRQDASIRYPEMRRAEDSVYLDAWREKRYALLDAPDTYHLFIRCFHGANTWEKHHFLTRMRNTVPDALKYVWYRYVRGDLFEHPRFQLSDDAWAAFERYLEESEELGLLSRPAACAAA